jgi:hypothetical protein
MADYPYSYYIALDGNGLNGLEGSAGVCRLLYDPASGNYDHRITYFHGAAAGHTISLSPDSRVGFLGNVGQHVILFDPKTLQELDRVSTMRFEVTDTTIRGSTHAVWLDDERFITAIGDWLYEFQVSNLEKPERLAAHGLKLPHSLKRTASGRFLCIGSMDHPVLGEAKEVGIFDLQDGTVRTVSLPVTCWHLVAHPKAERVYAVSFRVAPQEYRDYQQWAIAFLKEYVFEIDVVAGEVARHWVASREIPCHLNSDIVISDTELIWSNAASHTVMLLDLESFSTYRLIDERPNLYELARGVRSIATQVYDSLSRGSWYTSNHHLLTALKISRFSALDSIYGAALSADQTVLFTANRGLNRITIYDYPSTAIRDRIRMPSIQSVEPKRKWHADPRLGFHHSWLVSPRADS